MPALERDWGLSAAGAAWLVVAVQAGFIAGSIAAALLNLPDRIEPRRLIAGSAIAAAAANALLVLAGGLAAAITLRFLVGVALAGVYAPGVRLVATHYVRGRGVATGVVVGALTLGSATPHLVRGLGDVPWPVTILTTSALGLLAAAVIRPVTPGLDAPTAAVAERRRRAARVACQARAPDHVRLPGAHVGAVRLLGVASDVLRRIPPRGRRGRSDAPADGRDRLRRRGRRRSVGRNPRRTPRRPGRAHDHDQRRDGRQRGMLRRQSMGLPRAHSGAGGGAAGVGRIGHRRPAQFSRR